MQKREEILFSMQLAWSCHDSVWKSSNI